MNKNAQFDLLKDAIENKMPANKLLGIKIIELTNGFTKIHIPFKSEFIGDYIQKRWHGGVLASIADTVGGIAAMTSMDSLNDKVNTIDIRVDFLHGAKPKNLFAEAKIIKDGKRIIKVDVEIYHQKENIIAVARCAFSILRTPIN